MLGEMGKISMMFTMASSSKFYFLVALLSLLITEVAGEEGELYFHFLRADIKSLQFN